MRVLLDCITCNGVDAHYLANHEPGTELPGVVTNTIPGDIIKQGFLMHSKSHFGGAPCLFVSRACLHNEVT